MLWVVLRFLDLHFPSIVYFIFLRTKTNMLYITENSNNQSTCTRIIIKFDEHDDDKDRINM